MKSWFKSCLLTAMVGATGLALAQWSGVVARAGIQPD